MKLYRPIIAIFFTTFFMATLFAPTVMTLLGLEADIIVVMDTNEEEEKEGKESSKEKDVKIFQVLNFSIPYAYVTASNNSVFYSNSYTSNYLELLSPPPEQGIL